MFRAVNRLPPLTNDIIFKLLTSGYIFRHKRTNKHFRLYNISVSVPNEICLQRDDKRRATHNEIERRRRDKINSWITKLAALVPNSGLPDSASKGGILAKACDYITELTEKQKR